MFPFFDNCRTTLGVVPCIGENSFVVQFQFQFSSVSVQLQLSCSPVLIQFQLSCSSAQFSCSSVSDQVQFTFRSVSVQLQFSFSSAAVQFKFSFSSKSPLITVPIVVPGKNDPSVTVAWGVSLLSSHHNSRTSHYPKKDCIASVPNVRNKGLLENF